MNVLQEYLGLSCPQGIYHWQRGSTLPSTDNLYALSKLWGISINDILQEKNRITNNQRKAGGDAPGLAFS